VISSTPATLRLGYLVHFRVREVAVRSRRTDTTHGVACDFTYFSNTAD